jgi:hypothetical protein
MRYHLKAKHPEAYQRLLENEIALNELSVGKKIDIKGEQVCPPGINVIELFRRR